MTRSHGLVVKADNSRTRGCGFESQFWEMHRSFGLKQLIKVFRKLKHCTVPCAAILTMGG